MARSTKEGPGMKEELKDFLMRGNVVDLAVAVVIGIAFGAVVTAFIGGVIMPLIAAIVGEPNFDALIATVGDGKILYGTFLTSLVNFALVGTVLFFVVKAINRAQRPKEVDVTDPGPSETELLEEIRDLLRAQSRIN